MSLARISASITIYGFWVLLLIVILVGVFSPNMKNNAVYWVVGILLCFVFVVIGGFTTKLFVPKNSPQTIVTTGASNNAARLTLLGQAYNATNEGYKNTNVGRTKNINIPGGFAVVKNYNVPRPKRPAHNFNNYYNNER